MEIKSKVYVQTDERSRIIRCEGGYTTPTDLSGWVQIDEGVGDRFNLCQSNYFPSGLYTADGIPLYKLQDGKPVERTDDEVQTDRDAIVPPPQAPSAEDMTAVLSLARRQAQELSDAQALEVPVLYPYWAPGIPYGGEGGDPNCTPPSGGPRATLPLWNAPHITDRLGAGERPCCLDGNQPDQQGDDGRPHPCGSGHGVHLRQILRGPRGRENLPLQADR